MPVATAGATGVSSSVTVPDGGGLLRRRGQDGGPCHESGLGEPRDLAAHQRAAQVAHRPAGGGQRRLVGADALEHELPLAERRDRLADGADVDAAGGALQPVDEPRLVLLGLQAADEPRAGVGQRLVVDVDRVLGGQHHAEPEGPGLLEQQHDRLLGRRVRGRRQVAGDLVHVEQRPQVGGAALPPHPRDELGEDQGGDRLALLVRQVCRRHDGAAGPAVGRVQHRFDVDGIAGHPRGEARRGQQAVEPHGEGGTIRGGEELVELEHPELAHRRLLHAGEERGEVEVLALAP